MHEVTTFRRDVQTDGRHAKVEFGASLDEDLARRDFTMNAIAYHPIREVIHDPFGGREDLARGIVRAVGVAEERMREDRLRALRAIRFASRFGFEIEPSTWEAIVHSAAHMRRLSAERVKQELEKTMEQVDRPGLAIRRWIASGAMAVLVPPLAGLPETLTTALDCLPRPRPGRRLELADARKKYRLAMLFLHADAARTAAALRDLRFSNADVSWISSLSGAWHQLGGELTAAAARADPPSDGDIRRWAARVGRLRLGPLLRLAAAVWAARRTLGQEPAPTARQTASLYRRAFRIAWRESHALEIKDLVVDGDDLQQAGVPPGPWVGKILRALLERVIDDPTLNTRDRLLALAAEIYGRPRDDEGGHGPSRT
jgi:tRNA nucleotidyltransferase (CCA-adding enzyme)